MPSVKHGAVIIEVLATQQVCGVDKDFQAAPESQVPEQMKEKEQQENEEIPDLLMTEIEQIVGLYTRMAGETESVSWSYVSSNA